MYKPLPELWLRVGFSRIIFYY